MAALRRTVAGIVVPPGSLTPIVIVTGRGPVSTTGRRAVGLATLTGIAAIALVIAGWGGL